MAALYGMGIDNALIDLDGPEVPIIDGSAAPWVTLIEEAGIIDQEAERVYFELKHNISHVDESRKTEIMAVPTTKPRYSVMIQFNSESA